MAEMNELLDQGATLCDDMADVLKDAQEEVEAMVASGDTLDEALHNEVGELRGSLKSLTTALQKAKNNLDGGGDEAESALEQLDGRGESVADDSVVLVNAGKEGSANVEEALAQVSQMLDSKAELLTGDFERLGEAITDLHQATQDQVEDAQEALNAFGKGLGEAHADLDKHRAEWLTAVDELTTEIMDQTKEVFEGMVDVLKAQGTALLGLGKSLVEDHNKALSSVDYMFAEESVRSVRDTVQPLVDQLIEVTNLAGTRKGELSEKGQAILNALVGLIAEIEDITIQLRTTQGL